MLETEASTSQTSHRVDSTWPGGQGGASWVVAGLALPGPGGTYRSMLWFHSPTGTVPHTEGKSPPSTQRGRPLTAADGGAETDGTSLVP